MTIAGGFLEALPFPEKSPEISDRDDIFGWMIGSWEMEAVLYDNDGREHEPRVSCKRRGCPRGEQFRTCSFFRAGRTAPAALQGASIDTAPR